MKLTYKFKAGPVDGTLDQIIAIGAILKEPVNADLLENLPDGYYNSSTRGILKVADMDTKYLRNAIIRRIVDYYQILGKEELTITEFLNKFVKFQEDKEVNSLFEELVKRSKIDP